LLTTPADQTLNPSEWKLSREPVSKTHRQALPILFGTSIAILAVYFPNTLVNLQMCRSFGLPFESNSPSPDRSPELPTQIVDVNQSHDILFGLVVHPHLVVSSSKSSSST